MITLRFVEHPGLFNVACKIAQYGFWCSHSEAVLPEGGFIGSRFLQGGVKIEASDYDTGDFKKQKFVNVKASKIQEDKFFEFLRSQIGKPYDWQAIIAFATDRDWQEQDSWFCSELIAAALAYCGLFPQHMAVGFSRITPRDLLLIISALTEVGNA